MSMYCNNCGKHNPEDSKFCKSCGSKIIRVSSDKNTDNQAEAGLQETENNTPSPKNEKVKAGLTGWLALVGLGLIVNPLLQGYSLLGYLPYFSQTSDIPGYMGLLQLEFVASIILTIAGIYLLVLYLKKNVNFPKYYITYLISSSVYVIIDHLILASLTAPTLELQNVISNALSENITTVTRTVVFAIIWSLYMTKSKQVKATFIKS